MEVLPARASVVAGAAAPAAEVAAGAGVADVAGEAGLVERESAPSTAIFATIAWGNQR